VSTKLLIHDSALSAAYLQKCSASCKNILVSESVTKKDILDEKTYI
jgi:hypothetical protein